jgi:hypothetical protein
LDAAEISRVLESVIPDDNLINLAQTSNLIVAKRYLDEDEIKKIAMKFYSL